MHDTMYKCEHSAQRTVIKLLYTYINDNYEL